MRAKILSISLAPYLHAKSPTQSDENRPSTVVARKSDSYLSAIKERGGLPVLNIRCRLSQGWGHFLVLNYTTNSKCMDTIFPFFLRNVQRLFIFCQYFPSVKFVILITIHLFPIHSIPNSAYQNLFMSFRSELSSTNPFILWTKVASRVELWILVGLRRGAFPADG